MLTEKEERKLKALINKYNHIHNPFDLVMSLKNGLKCSKMAIKDAKQLYKLLLKHYGENIIEFNKQFYTHIHNWKRIIAAEKPIYDAPKKPLRKRQDNKTEINYGSGYHSGPSIRYPKKCRKTAWKRFYKLFPHVDPSLTKKEANEVIKNKRKNRYGLTEAEKILNKK